MKRLLLLVFACLGMAARAQISESPFQMIMSGGVPEIRVEVRDAATDMPLSGATVRLAFPKGDTVSMAADVNGEALYSGKIPDDSLTVFVSFVGYKSLQLRYKVKSFCTCLIARMTEDSESISQIIVRGDRIAMVLKGDTTIYNASAFTTMRGDAVVELLKKLPGVEFREGTFYANGERVKRILVNGTSLFGTNTKDASELIRADEVRNVKIYDQHTEQERMTGDTLGKKERVIDVATKEKKTRATQTELSGLFGGFLDRTDNGNLESVWGASGMTRNYILNKPALFGVAIYGDNCYGRSVSNTREKNMHFAFEVSKKDTSRVTYRTGLSFGENRSSDRSSWEDVYFPSQDYASRNYINRMSERQRTRQLGTGNDFTYRLNKQNYLIVALNATYDRKQTDVSEQASSSVDEQVVDRMSLARRDKTSGYSLTGQVGYMYYGKGRKRTLSANFSFSRSDNDGSGWRVDTLASSTRQQWLTNSTNGWNNAYNLEVRYKEPLSKSFSMNVNYSLKSRDSRSGRLAMDELTRWTDTLNTYKYTLRDATHLAGMYFSYVKSRVFRISIGVDYQSVWQKRSESFPEDYALPKSFDNLLPSFSFSYLKPVDRLSFSYKETTNSLSVEELRARIDDSNPLFLRAGNPGLKLGLNRTLTLDYDHTSIASAASWNVKIVATFTSNYLANKMRYFKEDTPLPEYDYTVAAGATLTTPVNVDGKRSAEASVVYSKSSSWLSSTWRAGLAYRFDRTPYFNADLRHNNDLQELEAGVSFQSGFSQHVELNIASETRLGYTAKGAGETYKSIQEVVSGSLRVNFLKRIWIRGRAGYDFYNTTLKNTLQKQVILDASLSCKFGKLDAGEVGLNFNDLLNQTKNFVVTMQDDYIRTKRSQIFGRSCYLSLAYKF